MIQKFPFYRNTMTFISFKKNNHPTFDKYLLSELHLINRSKLLYPVFEYRSSTRANAFDTSICMLKKKSAKIFWREDVARTRVNA